MDVPGHQAPLRTAAVAIRAVTIALALVAGLLAAPGPAAQAQPNDLELGRIGNIELQVGGGDQNVQIDIRNRGALPASDVQLTMTVPLREFGVHIASAPGECDRLNDNTRMDCVIDEIGPAGTHQIVAQVGVPGNSPLQAGETRNGTAEAVLDGGGSESFNVRLQGPDRPSGVPEVSGYVTDEATGERISEASVLLVDSQNVELTTTTDGNGDFRFAGEEIAAGSIGLQARKEGYEGQQFIEQGRAGESLTGVQLTLRSTATPTPTATASPTPTATATATASTAVAAAADESDGGSAFTTFLIIVGLLFVLLGVGAIVLLIIRRRREQREDGGPAGAAYPTSGPRGPGPRPGSHGVYRPAPADQTQVIGGRGVPAVGPSPALADAPTAMQPRGGASDQTTMIPPRGGGADQTTMIPPRGGGADQTAMIPRPGDPRSGPPRPGEPRGPRPPAPGAPPPRPGAPSYDSSAAPDYGSPAAPTGYQPAAGQQPTAGYQPPPTGYQPSTGHQAPAGRAGGGYGGSYGPDPYTQPPPRPASPPPPPAAGYRPPGPSGADGYSEPEYYQQPPSYGGGPDRSGAHHRAAEPSGYDQPGHGGDDRSGYQQPGYDRSGYDQPGYQQPGYEQPGYDQPGYRGGDYYDETGQPRGRHAEPPPERRRLDWLDDT